MSKSETISHKHPRTLGWLGTVAVAMGGSNQSLFIISALLIGQGNIPGQGTIAILLLIIGLFLSWAAAPGWLELVLMYPNRVGGIAACCTEAFKPYNPLLSNLTGFCYWWGWIPTCGLTALLSASAINQWYMPWFPVPYLATLIVVASTIINLFGIRFTTQVSLVIASISASLALLSGLLPIITGQVNWAQATSFTLTTPFPGIFGQFTSFMAGLYLVGFAAPAFEQATCHVGETKSPEKNVPKALKGAAIMAGLYFIVLPVVWQGTLGAELSNDLTIVLGPTFSAVFGNFAKAAAIWCMIFNMLHGSLAPLAGSTRTLSQLSEDGLAPEWLNKYNRYDCPYTATLFTMVVAIAFLWIGNPIWLVAAANLTYLLGIALPSVAVYLLRINEPHHERLYRAPRGTITLGLFSAFIWFLSTIFGFQQFGLPTVLIGIFLAYTGSIFYAWRKFTDRRKKGLSGLANSLHIKLTGAMLIVLILDSVGYIIAVNHVSIEQPALITGLEDIFVAVALLTIAVGLILPGMIAQSAVDISKAANYLANGVMKDFSQAMLSLGKGDLEATNFKTEIHPVVSRSNDEIGNMAKSFNLLQEGIRHAAIGYKGAREHLQASKKLLIENNITLKELNDNLEQRVKDRTLALEQESLMRKKTEAQLVASARQAGMAEVSSSILHNVGNILNTVNVSALLLIEKLESSQTVNLEKIAHLIKSHKDNLSIFLTEDPQGKQLPEFIIELSRYYINERKENFKELKILNEHIHEIKSIINLQQSLAGVSGILEQAFMSELLNSAIKINSHDDHDEIITIHKDYQLPDEVMVDKSRLMQIIVNLIRNAKESIINSSNPYKEIKVHCYKANDDTIIVEVADSGGGILAENIDRIFSYGFTTKKNGHGFGLHSSALGAIEMKGSLSVKSEGLNKGATFILTLPYKKVDENK